MDKKIINLIICILVCLIVILGLFIYRLIIVREEVTTTEKTETVLEETVIEDPVENGFKVHRSENGYTVKYPEDMEAKQMAKSIDFILKDEQSKSSLNIVSAKNDGSLKKMNREEFENTLTQMSSDVALISYEDMDLNGIDAVVAEYIYMDNVMKQIIVITESMGYNITVTEGVNISEETAQIFDSVVQSFTLN